MKPSARSVKVSAPSSAPAERLYEFPPGVVVRLVTARKDVLSHFDAEYGRLAIQQASKPQLELHTGDYARLLASLPAKMYRSELRGRHKTIRWRIAVCGLDNETTRLVFDGMGAMAISFLQTFYLEPLLRFKILQAGCALVHGCTLVSGTKSVLFPGGTAVGKTTLMLSQAMRGGKVQGDNYVIVTPKGETYAFPRRLRIYSDLRRTNTEAYRGLPLGERMRLRANALIKVFSLGYANFPRRLSIEQLVPEYKIDLNAVRLGSLFVLTADEGRELTGPNPLTLDEIIQRIQVINGSEGDRLAKVVGPYLSAHSTSRFHSMEETERTVLSQAFEGLPAFEILVPRVSNPASLVSQLRGISRID